MIDGLQCVDLLDIPSLLRLISFGHFKKVVFEKFGQCLFSSLFITYLAVKAATFSTCLDNTCIYIFLSSKEVTKNVRSIVTSGSTNCLACTAADPLLLIHIMDF